MVRSAGLQKKNQHEGITKADLAVEQYTIYLFDHTDSNFFVGLYCNTLHFL